nr:rRNA-processing protein UTP23 homolog [Ipomoea batatas]
MKVKKQTRHRNFLQHLLARQITPACFGFHKVLCDGMFMHHLLDYEMTPAHTALVNTLGAPVRLFTTRCVVEELKSEELKRILRDTYPMTLDAASSLLTVRCGHKFPIDSGSCVREVIGRNNPENFYVASRDPYVLEGLRQILGVSIIYPVRKALFLERVTEVEEKRKCSDDEWSDDEWSDEGASEEEEGHGLEVQNVKKRKKNRNHLQFKHLRFKRKKSKNLNPLSLKKKKKSSAESEKRKPRKMMVRTRKKE